MVLIRASAPNKLHLAGEHSVVYGGWALMVPVEIQGKRNVVTLTDSADSAFHFSGDLGTAVLEDGQKKGDSIYFPVLDVVLHVCGKLNQPVPSLHATLEWSGSPKGTGNSASIPVALAMGLFSYFGYNPSRQELYDAGFAGDNAYHGGKSSGGDVTAVLTNKIQKFRRVFENGQIKPIFEELNLQLPLGTELLLVESHRTGDRTTTAALIEQFAKAHGIRQKPAEMSESSRKAIIQPFDAVVQKIESLCRPDADLVALGKAFDENHALLKSVTTPDIDLAIQTAKSAGALGGKLIGAGGNGGSLIVLARDSQVSDIQFSLKQNGFHSYPVTFPQNGPKLD